MHQVSNSDDTFHYLSHSFSDLVHFIQFTVYLRTKICDIYNIHTSESRKSDKLPFMESIGAHKIRSFVYCLLVAIISLSFVLFAEIMWRLLLVLFCLLSFPPPTPTPSWAEFGFYLVLYNCLRHTVSDSIFTTKQIKLLNFEGETLTSDGGILRRIKVKGDGFSNPNEGANVHSKKKEANVFFADTCWSLDGVATFLLFCRHSSPEGNLQRQNFWLQGCQLCRGRGWR